MKIFSIAILLFLSLPIFSQDHLYPEDSIYGSGISSIEYHQYVTKAFHVAFSRDVILKVFVIPSFYPESVLYIEKSADSYYVSYLEAETRYWTVDREEYQPNPIKKCRTVLSKLVVDNIENVWINELSKTRHAKRFNLGEDGTSYHFSASLKWLSSKQLPRPPMAGQTMSPEKESRMGKLVNLISVIKGYCLSPNSEEIIQQSINKLADK
ncbi:hypothetical protein J7384_18545 [Endozoicomonas sp. G2_1]|uniref:hypothetical protein n=1 Tax=Endozoicomonas sp. G2_1 TaxID=2821091 RepID=UPI001ADA64A1|nr:hypothetical protein [Endozoicomonas sp. G2_1]MBO9492368.1 hypothetical protein [Endozoicomonas sp. G2_1]